MNTEAVELKVLKVHKANPRLIRDYKFQSLINSILVFPEMLEIRPIVVDAQMQALGGNMRTKALLSISQMEDSEIISRLNKLNEYKNKTTPEKNNLIQYWQTYKDKPIAYIVKASNLTETQQREFIIKDNVGFGEWDFDMLANEWDLKELNEWGLDLDFPVDDVAEEIAEEEKKFVIEIACKSKDEQNEALTKLSNMGYECKSKSK